MKVDRELYCTLAFDEMAIRNHVQYSDSQKKFLGLITYGSKDGEVPPVASNAIVFMVNFMDEPLSLPIAYHLIGTLSAPLKAQMWQEVVSKITETGMNVLCTTFDGMSTNFSMMRELGASFESDDFRPSVHNPVDNSEIKIILDPCHMLKLIRNCLHKKSVLYDNNNRKIEWAYFEKLVFCKEKKGFQTHKLNKAHIEFTNNQMKVNLAAELFSRSVANSMEYLKNAGVESFDGCAGTINFTRIINDLFDILNTGHNDTLEKNNGNIFKVPLTIDNAEEIISFLNIVESYLPSLRLHGKGILDTNRKTGYLGFLIDIHNLKKIYLEYVVSGKIARIPTYCLGQDSLESFFSRIRSKLGDNTNPTAEQYKANFRKIMINRELKASGVANCRDNLNILQIPSTHISHVTQEKEPHNIDIELFNPNDYLLNLYEDAAIVNISAEIDQKIRNQFFHCELCSNVLSENRPVDDSSNISVNCQAPCISTTHICKVGKKYFDLFTKQPHFMYHALYEAILTQIDLDVMYCNSDFSAHKEHKLFLVEFTVEEYIRYRAHELARTLTLREQSQKLRSKLTRTIHFMGI